MVSLSREDFLAAREYVSRYARRTPLLTSRQLNERTGYDVYLKAEMLQRTGSYKFRGPLNKLMQLTDDQKQRGVICSSAGNHAQGVALAAQIYGIRAVVCMAENATPSKVAATRGYGAEVVLHGTIWDEANAKALELAAEQGLTMIHPFDDLQLIAGQGTVGLEIAEGLPELDAVLVPIGGGGLISGVSMAVKSLIPTARIFGVESADAPGMAQSVAAGGVVTLDHVGSVIDGLRVQTVGSTTFQVVSEFVDEIVTLPDAQIFDAVVWVMNRCKLVIEGAAAAPVAALLQGLIDLPAGSRVVCVLSGGNVNLDRLGHGPFN